MARSQLPCPRQLASFCACSRKRLHHLSKCTLMCCYQLATCCQQQLKSDCFLEPSRSARQHNLSTCLALQLPGAKRQNSASHCTKPHSDTLGCDQHLLNTTLQHTSKLHAQPLASTAKVWSLETLIIPLQLHQPSSDRFAKGMHRTKRSLKPCILDVNICKLGRPWRRLSKALPGILCTPSIFSIMQ